MQDFFSNSMNVMGLIALAILGAAIVKIIQQENEKKRDKPS